MARVIAALAFLLVALCPAAAQARDHDKLPDRWERKHHLNLKKNDARRDRDRDGLSNFREYRAHTNPRKKDSDHDGLRDRAEIRYRFNPRDRDSDDDGIKDGRENAGKVKQLSGSSITIRLAAGGRLTARLALGCPATGDAPAPESDPVDAPPADDPADAPAEDPGDDPESDEGDDPAPPDADAAQAEDDPFTDDQAFDDDVFDRQFELEFSAGGEECGSSRLKPGALIHEATVDRSGPSPVVTAVELVAR